MGYAVKKWESRRWVSGLYEISYLPKTLSYIAVYRLWPGSAFIETIGAYAMLIEAQRACKSHESARRKLKRG